MTNEFNIFQQIQRFQKLCDLCKESEETTKAEKSHYSLFNESIKIGKMFLVEDQATFEPIDDESKFQNLPFKVMYLVAGQWMWICLQNDKNDPIRMYAAVCVDNLFEILDFGATYYNENGIMKAEHFDIAGLRCAIIKDDLPPRSEIFNSAMFYIAQVNEKKDDIIESTNTPARKCKPAENKFRVRFSVIGTQRQKQHIIDNSKKSHRKVALHDRRGHYRRLPDKTVWVRACKVGSIKNGITIQQYKVGTSNDK